MARYRITTLACAFLFALLGLALLPAFLALVPLWVTKCFIVAVWRTTRTTRNPGRPAGQPAAWKTVLGCCIWLPCFTFKVVSTFLEELSGQPVAEYYKVRANATPAPSFAPAGVAQAAEDARPAENPEPSSQEPTPPTMTPEESGDAGLGDSAMAAPQAPTASSRLPHPRAASSKSSTSGQSWTSTCLGCQFSLLGCRERKGAAGMPLRWRQREAASLTWAQARVQNAESGLASVHPQLYEAYLPAWRERMRRRHREVELCEQHVDQIGRRSLTFAVTWGIRQKEALQALAREVEAKAYLDQMLITATQLRRNWKRWLVDAQADVAAISAALASSPPTAAALTGLEAADPAGASAERCRQWVAALPAAGC